jgi:IS30 family transposase
MLDSLLTNRTDRTAEKLKDRWAREILNRAAVIFRNVTIDFKVEMTTFNRVGKDFKPEMKSLNRGMEGFSRGTQNFNRRAGNFLQKMTDFNQKDVSRRERKTPNLGREKRLPALYRKCR